MVLKRNNSQNAGCMRRSPASHCCQVRQVVCNRSAAAVCESPAASRAARTSSGVGLRAGLPARLRLGWLPILGFDLDASGQGLENPAHFFAGDRVEHVRVFKLDASVEAVFIDESLSLSQRVASAVASEELLVVGQAHAGKPVAVVAVAVGLDGGDRFNGGHFWLQPLSPEARLWRIHTLNNTRIARNVKAKHPIDFMQQRGFLL